MNTETGEMVTAPCKRRLCHWCGPAIYGPDKSARIARGASWNGYRYYMLTLTAPGWCDASCGGKGAHSGGCKARSRGWNKARSRRAWSHFITLWRRAFPRLELDFFKVWELQDREALHLHAMVRLRGMHLPAAVISRMATRAGFGTEIQWETMQSAGDAGSYLRKYLLKDLGTTSSARPWSWSSRWVYRLPVVRIGGIEKALGYWAVPPRRAGSPWVFLGLTRAPPDAPTG